MPELLAGNAPFVGRDENESERLQSCPFPPIRLPGEDHSAISGPRQVQEGLFTSQRRRVLE